MTMNRPFLPAEWEEQAFIQLTWPHKETDWDYMLDEVEECYINIAREILSRERLIVVTPEPEHVEQVLAKAGICLDNLTLVKIETNDTWARDHAFITTIDEDGNAILNDFCFNGWGMKFAANLDNQINKKLMKEDLLQGKYVSRLNFVLEGGSIESDSDGTLLTTAECLLSDNRNDTLSREEIEKYLKSAFHVEKVLWIENGFLEGDDTDSHIDTLARLCPDNTIVYVKCNDKDDIHYSALKAMEDELFQFTNCRGEHYRLLPLPFPDAVYDENDERLPATYANFLIMNEAVLCPVYNQEENDKEALKVLKSAFPDHEIIGIDCSPLIRQHGSLHCITMQYPKCVQK